MLYTLTALVKCWNYVISILISVLVRLDITKAFYIAKNQGDWLKVVSLIIFGRVIFWIMLASKVYYLATLQFA